SVVLYDRFKTNRRTANQRSPWCVTGSRKSARGIKRKDTVGSRSFGRKTLPEVVQHGKRLYSKPPGSMTRHRAVSVVILVLSLGLATIQPAGGRASITPGDLKDWLTFLASDELEGRAVFTEGLGIAAGNIQGYLQAWGVKPGGDHGGYLQTVRVRGVKVTNRSTLTVHVGNDSRTFKDGEGVAFPHNVGARRTLTIDRVEFTGYGLDVPGHTDLRGKSIEDAAVVFLGTSGPK